MQLSGMTKHREAWLEWVSSKQGVMQHVSSVLAQARAAQAQASAQAGTAAVMDAAESAADTWRAERRGLQQQVRVCVGGGGCPMLSLPVCTIPHLTILMTCLHT